MSAADLRAQRARLQVPIYLLAASVKLHPNTLGGMLAGRRPMPEDVAIRVAEALQWAPAAETPPVR